MLRATLKNPHHPNNLCMSNHSSSKYPFIVHYSLSRIVHWNLNLLSHKSTGVPMLSRHSTHFQKKICFTIKRVDLLNRSCINTLNILCQFFCTYLLDVGKRVEAETTHKCSVLKRESVA